MGRRPAAVTRLPTEPGIYRFRDAGGGVLYLGRAVDLRRRVSSYWGDLGDRGHLTRMVRRIARVEALVCASEHEAAWAERNLLEQSLPRWNRARGGEEASVHILLDASARSPGLRVVHHADPAPSVRVFGPYLGGRKVRLAVSALQRIFPLASCGTHVTAAERDLARRRQIAVPTLPELAAAVAAVLDREPAAVAATVADLRGRRDAAAADLRFEVAARIEEELAAVTWVVALQRVTDPRGGHADLRGWADGTQLRLVVRDGRVCGWEQDACPHNGSGVSGPPSWAPFLARNAALAAALARLPVPPDRPQEGHSGGGRTALRPPPPRP